MSSLRLRMPNPELLPEYAKALETGWSPTTTRDVSGEQLDAIRADPDAFIRDLLDLTGIVMLPDGTEVPRLPFKLHWMEDGEFCGSINLRWQPGTHELPKHVLGHIGYSVVPWKRRRGYATTALGMVLAEARDVGLDRVEITTDVGNIASRRVIEKAGGRLVEYFESDHHGPITKLRFVVDLN
jgi:predicted acetyltransferase